MRRTVSIVGLIVGLALPALLAQNAGQMMIAIGDPHRSVAFIAGKTLISAIAIQRYSYVLASHLRQVISWDCRRIGIRLAVMPDQSR